MGHEIFHVGIDCSYEAWNIIGGVIGGSICGVMGLLSFFPIVFKTWRIIIIITRVAHVITGAGYLAGQNFRDFSTVTAERTVLDRFFLTDASMTPLHGGVE